MAEPEIKVAVRITGFDPFGVELIGRGPYTLPVSIQFPTMKFKAIDLGWAVDGAYYGGDGEFLRYTLSGEGEISAGKLVEFMQNSADEWKKIYDIYQDALMKVALLD